MNADDLRQTAAAADKQVLELNELRRYLRRALRRIVRRCGALRRELDEELARG